MKYSVKMRDLFNILNEEIAANKEKSIDKINGNNPIVIKVRSGYLKNLRPVDEFDDVASIALIDGAIPKIVNVVSEVDSIVTFNNLTSIVIKPKKSDSVWRKGKVSEMSSVISSIVASELMAIKTTVGDSADDWTVINEIEIFNLKEEFIEKYFALEQLQAYNEYADKKLRKFCTQKEIEGNTLEEKIVRLRFKLGPKVNWRDNIITSYDKRQLIKVGDKEKWKVEPVDVMPDFIEMAIKGD